MNLLEIKNMIFIGVRGGGGHQYQIYLVKYIIKYGQRNYSEFRAQLKFSGVAMHKFTKFTIKSSYIGLKEFTG